MFNQNGNPYWWQIIQRILPFLLDPMAGTYAPPPPMPFVANPFMNMNPPPAPPPSMQRQMPPTYNRPMYQAVPRNDPPPGAPMPRVPRWPEPVTRPPAPDFDQPMPRVFRQQPYWVRATQRPAPPTQPTLGPKYERKPRPNSGQAKKGR